MPFSTMNMVSARLPLAGIGASGDEVEIGMHAVGDELLAPFST